MELVVQASILPAIIMTEFFPSSTRESCAVPLSLKTLVPTYKFELRFHRSAAFLRFRLLERRCLTGEVSVSSENGCPSMSSVTFQENSGGNTSLLDTASVSYQEASMETEHRTGYVAVLGRPNVGKSTLCNQMVGQKLSIVTDKPQTTRHRILGICSAPDHQIILYDTPGIIKKNMNKLDLMMMRGARAAAWNADCVMVVVDASTSPQKIDDVVRKVGKEVPILVALNKRDLLKSADITVQLKWYERLPGIDDVIPISAKNADGVEDVKQWILSKLPLGPPLYPKDIVSERPERFFIAEIVREKVFMYYRDEIPYSCRVDVVDYVFNPQAKDFIKVEITVEKRSQIGILVGHGGQALKCISIAANSDIEKFVDKEVYLEIKVRVRKKWRKDEGNLKSYV